MANSEKIIRAVMKAEYIKDVGVIGKRAAKAIVADKEREREMKERFTRFKKRVLIKMWRTLKAESGYRMTKGYIPDQDITLRELMNAHEERVKR